MVQILFHLLFQLFWEKISNKRCHFSARRKTIPKRQIDGLLRKQELFDHIHSLSIFLFQRIKNKFFFALKNIHMRFNLVRWL